MFFFLHPDRKLKGIFLCYLLWELGQTLKGKSHNIVGVPLGLGPAAVFNFQELSSVSLQQLINHSSGFSTPSLVPTVNLLVLPASFCSSKPWWPAFTCLPLRPWRQQFAHYPSSLTEQRRIVDFFQSIQFFIVVRKEWQLPASLHMKPAMSMIIY